jgi:hypothetical protein
MKLSAPPLWPDVIQPWEPDADDQRKLEVLRIQHDLLLENVRRLRTEGFQRLADLQNDLSAAEARVRAMHEEMARTLAAKDRLAAQIDARGLWPIGFGILLTGIPAELAYHPVLGIAVTALGVILTVTLAWAGMMARRGRST